MLLSALGFLRGEENAERKVHILTKRIILRHMSKNKGNMKTTRAFLRQKNNQFVALFVILFIETTQSQCQNSLTYGIGPLSMYGNLTHYVSGTGPARVFRLTSSKTKCYYIIINLLFQKKQA